MNQSELHKAIDQLSSAKYAVGVSGGADSVALLLLLSRRSDLQLHVVHLDHETRSGESAKDAFFVAQLSAGLKLPVTIRRRSEIESTILNPAKNMSARYRQARFSLFAEVVIANQLDGVVLAHHADDQAETVLMRILRGSTITSLTGIQSRSVMKRMVVHRPLLNISPVQLKEFLSERQQAWREDASNQSSAYKRNRIRKWLQTKPKLRRQLLGIAREASAISEWLQKNSATLPAIFLTSDLHRLPHALAQPAAASWLVSQGVPPNLMSKKVAEALIEMAADAATPSRRHFPGGLSVTRQKNKIQVK